MHFGLCRATVLSKGTSGMAGAAPPQNMGIQTHTQPPSAYAPRLRLNLAPPLVSSRKNPPPHIFRDGRHPFSGTKARSEGKVLAKGKDMDCVKAPAPCEEDGKCKEHAFEEPGRHQTRTAKKQPAGHKNGRTKILDVDRVGCLAFLRAVC